MPAPDGEVVEPIVDAAMLKEAEKNTELARIKRELGDAAEPVVKKELSIVDVITLDSEEARHMNDAEIADFALSLGKPGAKKAAVKAEPKAKGEKVGSDFLAHTSFGLSST